MFFVSELNEWDFCLMRVYSMLAIILGFCFEFGNKVLNIANRICIGVCFTKFVLINTLVCTAYFGL